VFVHADKTGIQNVENWRTEGDKVTPSKKFKTCQLGATGGSHFRVEEVEFPRKKGERRSAKHEAEQVKGEKNRDREKKFQEKKKKKSNRGKMEIKCAAQIGGTIFGGFFPSRTYEWSNQNRKEGKEKTLGKGSTGKNSKTVGEEKNFPRA